MLKDNSVKHPVQLLPTSRIVAQSILLLTMEIAPEVQECRMWLQSIMDGCVAEGTSENRLRGLRRTANVELPDTVYELWRKHKAPSRWVKRSAMVLPAAACGTFLGMGVVAAAGLHGAAASSAFWAGAGFGAKAAGGLGMVGGQALVGTSAGLTLAAVGANASSAAKRMVQRELHPVDEVEKAAERLFKENDGTYSDKLHRPSLRGDGQKGVLARVSSVASAMWDSERDHSKLRLVYEGQFRLLQFQGKGTLHLECGAKMEGDFYQGLPNGGFDIYEVDDGGQWSLTFTGTVIVHADGTFVVDGKWRHAGDWWQVHAELADVDEQTEVTMFK
jgi:hypothetical protein